MLIYCTPPIWGFLEKHRKSVLKYAIFRKVKVNFYLAHDINELVLNQLEISNFKPQKQ